MLPNLHLVFLCLVGVVWTAGCAPTSVANSDPRQARELVDRLLSAWKSGATPLELKHEVPPVFVGEELWKSGASLSSYEIIGDHQMMGPNVRFTILLRFTDRNGKAVERTFNYLVTTTPALTFFREEG